MLDKILHLGEGKQVKKLAEVARQVSSIEPDYLAMDNDELRAQTADFRARLDRGAALDDLLPEAFATVREASRRVLDKRHFDVQIMGGTALHQGTIAEMKTGEGKTLVAVLPSYLNGLAGQGVHIVTVNDYLAKFQSEQMGRVHHFLGLEVGVILAHKSPAERRQAYAADITYGTNNEFGFDFLRDNMALKLADCVQRGHHYAIVDEVDSILVDEARTPLIISGPAEDNAQWYPEFARIARDLSRDRDYEVDERKRTVSILDSGITVVERRLGIDNLYESANTPLISYLNNAIKAKELFHRDKEYVVSGGEVLIVDEFTGRTLLGRRYNEGLHQALEAKEGVEIKAEYQTLATITLQNYFRMYRKLAGMTGTAKTEESEFQKIYGLRVLPIPTHEKMIRIDQKDFVYRTEAAKFTAIVDDIVTRHEKGQPVLIGTASVDKSEELSRQLRRAGIPHQVLNAKQHAREAAVVALAGRKGAVTVATNMAGRGTDIILGGNPEFLADAVLRERGLDPVEDPEGYEAAWPEAEAEIKQQVAAEHDQVVEVGGLYVVGSERHESRRIDNQLRGRSGRQGDPGESRFYLSLGDDLMRLFKGDMVDWVMRTLKLPDDVPIEDKRITKMIQSAQEQVEAQHFETRKNVLRYDDVMNRQRHVVYSDRRKVLEGADISAMLRQTVTKVVTSYVEGATEGFEDDWDLDQLWQTMRTLYPVGLELEGFEDRDLDRPQLVERFVQDAQQAYDQREREIGPEPMRQLERYVLLTVLDRKWREHLYEMDYLREGIGLRSMASRDPLVEYQREGAGMFAAMMDSVMEEVVGFLFRAQLVETPVPAPTVSISAPSRGRGGKASRPRAESGQTGQSGPSDPAGQADQSDAPAAPPAFRRSALDAEAAAARSEVKVTARGLASSPASTTLPAARAAKPIVKADTAELRASRPGASGRRNQGKRKHK
jgi:preprotein translocase subunit SecA